MTERLSQRLDERLKQLTEAGFSVRTVFACAASIQRLFEELGDTAVLMDCDPNLDRAWYGAYELSVADGEGVHVMHCRGDECWIRNLDDALDFSEGAGALKQETPDAAEPFVTRLGSAA